MNDLFTVRCRFVTHKVTGVVLIGIRDYWYNGEQYIDCAVPQTENGKDWYFANATYPINELEL